MALSEKTHVHAVMIKAFLRFIVKVLVKIDQWHLSSFGKLMKGSLRVGFLHSKDQALELSFFP